MRIWFRINIGKLTMLIKAFMIKNIFHKILFVASLVSLFSCAEETSGNGNPEQVSIEISPSKSIRVDSEGGKFSFDISVEPSTVQLKYASSVSWITKIENEQNTWMIQENESELSREGRIYILNASTLVHLDTIQVWQESVNGEVLEEPEFDFSEEDVPIYIPFRGNSYVTEPLGSAFIDNYSGNFSGDWIDKDIVVSSYFYVGGTGALDLALVGYNETGNSIVKIMVNDKSYNIALNGPTSKIYSIDRLEMETPGYVKVSMQGVSKSGKNFGVIEGFRIGNQASIGKNYYVTEEKMDESDLNCYFFRRGASVHFNYDFPEQDVEYFYNEVYVSPENAQNSTYYMMNGFAEGYMGIQQISPDERKVLFSVWSPYSTDNPEDIPENKRVQLLRKGENVTVGEFGNEGSGGQSWLNYNWTPGEVYKAIVQVKPDGNGSTIYTAYFFADGEWKLIASFKRPDTDTYYKGAYSFLENFDPCNSVVERSVSFRNQWVYLASGKWVEIKNAQFTCDDTGRSGMRHDYSGEYRAEDNSFVLTSFGFSDKHTEYGTDFQRAESPEGCPDVDFEALENIESVN